MIDTKIACQCGNRFKFGMDLVNGRAPEGLVCPTCGAPATAACNALVDFLSGQPSTAPSTGSRPVKEIKVTCGCGARYKFDLELAEQEMPSAVVCPGCQADLTSVANEEIRNYVTKHAADVSAPASAPVAPPAAAPSPAPTSVLPSKSPSVTAEPVPAPAPAAPAAPPAAAAPVVPPAPAKPDATPVSDPFGPPPAGKTGGPNLKPLEVPKPVRPPPGSKPAAPPPKPSSPGAPSAAKPAKSEPGKPAVKVEAAPAKAGREPNQGLGMAGAVVGALIGAALWFAVIKFTGRSGGFMALVVGALAGLGARTLGRTTSSTLGGVACVATLIVLGIMVRLAIVRTIEEKQAPQLALQFKAAMDRAQALVNAQTDAELKPFVIQTIPMADMSGSQVTEDQIKAFRATEVPKAQAQLNDKDYRAKFESGERKRYRAGYPLEEAWDEAFGMIGLLWLLGGVLASAKLAMK